MNRMDGLFGYMITPLNGILIASVNQMSWNTTPYGLREANRCGYA